MSQVEAIAAHVSYFSNLINIYEFYEHTGHPTPPHIRNLLIAAQARMEELTNKETKHEH